MRTPDGAQSRSESQSLGMQEAGEGRHGDSLAISDLTVRIGHQEEQTSAGAGETLVYSKVLGVGGSGLSGQHGDLASQLVRRLGCRLERMTGVIALH